MMEMASCGRVVFVFLLTLTTMTTLTVLADRPVAYCLGKMLTDMQIDYEHLGASSHCACRVMCYANASCTGVSARMNDEGKTDCFFSNVKIRLEQLGVDQKSNSWIHEVDGSTAAADHYDPQLATTPTATPTPTPIISTPPAATSRPDISKTTPARSISSLAATYSTLAATTTSALSTTTWSPSTTTSAPSTTTRSPSTTTSTSATTTASTSSTTTPEPVCEEGWKKFNDACYIYLESWETWSDAEKVCRTLGGHLAKVPTMEVLDFIAENVSEKGWIGLNNRVEEGTHIWISDNSEDNIIDERWRDGEPNFAEERCIFLYQGRFLDSMCYLEGSFLCEKTPSLPP